MGFWRTLKELVFTKTASHTLVDNGNSGASKNIDWSNGNKQEITLTANCTLTFTDPRTSCELQLIVKQDATGNFTLTFPASVKWSQGTVPTITTDANAIDVISLFFDGTNYLSNFDQDFS